MAVVIQSWPGVAGSSGHRVLSHDEPPLTPDSLAVGETGSLFEGGWLSLSLIFQPSDLDHGIQEVGRLHQGNGGLRTVGVGNANRI